MAIKLEMLRVFRIVAEQGSLADAARVLGRTPSAVSMMLAQLEDNIGAPLFETDRKNRLTKLGDLILAEAVRATDTFQASAAAITRLTTSIAGTVRIAAVPSVIATRLPAALDRFRRTHPEVRLEIDDVDSATVRQRIRRDQADIGILTARPEGAPEGVALGDDALGFVCREGGPIARALDGGAAPAWALLALEPLIANPLGALVSDPTVAAQHCACTLESRNTLALLSFVRQGLGATVLPEGATALLGEGLRFACPQDPATRRHLRMIASPERRLTPVAEAFWQTLLSDVAPRDARGSGQTPVTGL
jgi:DNA-binding transcriptional LysR family regulator